MTEKDLQNKIINKLSAEKPNNPQIYFWRDFLIGSAFFALILTAGILFSIYLWDLFSFSWNPNKGFFANLMTFSGSTLWEILLIIILLLSVSYILYRSSDFPLVSKRWLILSIFVISIIGFGFGLWLISERNEQLSNRFEQTHSNIRKIPYRQRRLQNIQDEFQRQGMYIGRVNKIREMNNGLVEINVYNQFESLTFIVEKSNMPPLKKGDRIVIKLDPQRPNTVLEIRKMPLNR